MVLQILMNLAETFIHVVVFPAGIAEMVAQDTELLKNTGRLTR